MKLNLLNFLLLNFIYIFSKFRYMKYGSDRRGHIFLLYHAMQSITITQIQTLKLNIWNVLSKCEFKLYK